MLVVAGVALAPARTVAAAAGAVLALSSTGDPLVAAAVLGVAAWRRLSTVALVLVAVAVTARWGSADLAVVAGGQSVLGPAGLLEPARAAVSAWLGAAALVAAWPGRIPPLVPPVTARRPAWSAPMAADLVGALAVGALAAALVWGPDAQGAVLERAAATVVATAAALGVGRLRRSGRVDRVAGPVAVALGALALVLALMDRAVPWPSADASALVPGLAVAVVATGLAVAGLRWRGRGSVAAHPVAVLGLWALATALGRDLVPASSLPLPPTSGLPDAAWLLAAAAVAGLVAGWRWGAAAALPGVAVVVHALLAGSLPVAPGAALACLLAVTALALLVRAAGDDAAPDLSLAPWARHAGRAVAVVLVAAPVPDGWPGVDGLAPWTRGAAVALAAALAAAAWALVARVRAGGGTARRGEPGGTRRYARSARARAAADPGALPPASTP